MYLNLNYYLFKKLKKWDNFTNEEKPSYFEKVLKNNQVLQFVFKISRLRGDAMWWVYVLMCSVFIVILLIKIIYHYYKTRKIIKMEAKNEFKHNSKLTFVKVADNRSVIYYSQGPINMRTDPGDFSLYKTRMMDVPMYVGTTKKLNRVRNAWTGVYAFFFILFLLVFLLTATGILLEEFYPQGLEFLDGEAGNYIRQFFTSYYVGVFALLLTILALIFMLCEISIKKLLNYYLPVYLKQVNAECYQESMKPIYVKLG